MSHKTKRFYEFDRFRIDVDERVLICDGEMLTLTQKAFDVLLALVERHGRVVSKEELMERVWPDTFVEESNLAQNIYTLRKVLGQTPDGAPGVGYIATVPRRGYRFAASVRVVSEPLEPLVNEEVGNSIIATEPVEAIASGAASPNEQPDFIRTESDDYAGAGANAGRAGRDESNAKNISTRRIGIGAVLLIAAAIAVWFVVKAGFFSRGDESPAQLSFSALTTAGNVATAAISPDGAYVGYATNDKADKSTLWIDQLSTSARRAVIPATENRYYALTFSRDGDLLYYVAATKDFPTRSLYRVSTQGGPSKKLVDNINAAVSFSPDGSRMALRRTVETRRVGTISIADSDGRNEKEIASIGYPDAFYDPAWSPNGEIIACAAGNPNGVLDMYVVGIRAADGATRTISKRRWRWVGQMDWLPDSRTIVMIAQENFSTPRQVWLLDYESGEARQITNDTSDYNRLSLAANAGALVVLQVKQITNVWMIPDADAGRAKQLTLAAGGYRGDLAWTPDNQIVYESKVGSAPAISIMGADGANPRLLTGELSGRSYVGRPALTPDGSRLVFVSDIKGVRNIWRLNIDGSNPVQLTAGTGEDDPRCSADGGRVFYTKQERGGVNRPTIWSASIDGGNETKLIDAFSAYPSPSPDGKLLACLYAVGPGNNPWRIAIYPIDGGAPIKIFPQAMQAQTVDWSADSRHIFYAENMPTGPSKIWVQSIDGDPPKQVAEFEPDRIFGFDWSRDGKLLACVRGFWSTDIVLIKDLKNSTD